MAHNKIQELKTKTQIKTFKDELADLTAQSMSSFNKSNIEKLDKFLQQDINVKRLNAELTEVTRSIELYPKGLPYNDCLNAVGKGYGKKENKYSPEMAPLQMKRRLIKMKTLSVISLNNSMKWKICSLVKELKLLKNK